MAPKVNGPKIKPQPKVTFETCTFKIDGPTIVRLKAYCEFIDSEQSYVIREALNFLFQSDCAFQTYLDSRDRKAEANTSPTGIALGSKTPTPIQNDPVS